MGAAARVSLALMLAFAGARSAWAADDLGPPPSAALQCLSPAAADRVKPVYPPRMLEIKRGAYVRARLTFANATSAPAVEFDAFAGDDFESAVTDYARQLRVPCMQAGAAPVTLTQVFDFVPNDGRKVALALPLDTDAEKAGRDAPCGVDTQAGNVPMPNYPDELARGGKEGTVVVRLRFSEPAQPPEITVLDNGGDKRFAHAAKRSIEALRMVCRGDKVVPFEIQVSYGFRIDGARGHAVLQDLTLPQFIAAAKPFARGGIFFDTNLMKCPFDVRLTFRQPWNRNKVDELEEDLPSRHAFLSWLSTLELDVPQRVGNRVLGQSMVVEVPCVKIDL